MASLGEEEGVVRTLSWYILRQYLPPFVLSFVAFLVIFVVIDLADRLNVFLDREVSAEIMVLFYTNYIPYISVLVLPMAMLLACLFCIGGLNRSHEILAMKAAGVSLYRIMLPLLVFALCVSLFSFWLGDRIVPEANYQRNQIEMGLKPISPMSIRKQVVIRDVDGQVLSMGQYDPHKKLGLQVTLDRYSGSILMEKVRAEEVRWGMNVWVFSEGERRQFQLDGEEVEGFESYVCDSLTLLPEDLERAPRPIEQMNIGELDRFIQRKIRNGGEAVKEAVELQLRMAFPFACFVIVLFGLPLASEAKLAGRPIQVGVCLLASFVYYGSLQAGRAMGWNGLVPAFWGAWGPNLIFLLIGSLSILRAHK